MIAIAQRIERYSTSDELAKEGCAHNDQIHEVEPMARGCVDCLKTGDTWIHLRMCLTCGYVGCCDSSRNRHTTKHHQATGHPLYTSMEPNEDWVYCYLDETIVFP